MVSKSKSNSTILPHHWSDFYEQVAWVLLPWGTFQSGSERGKVVLFVIPSCGFSLWDWTLG